MIRVLAPGALTTVQDGGRVGSRALGVGCAGALDPYAFAIANLLVGNAADAPALEITLAGPRLQFDSGARIALCGAFTRVTDIRQCEVEQGVPAREAAD